MAQIFRPNFVSYNDDLSVTASSDFIFFFFNNKNLPNATCENTSEFTIVI